MGVSDWIWTTALRKVVTNAVLALLAAYGANLAHAGITIDKAALIAALVGALEFLRGLLKHKVGLKVL